jgi:hypothetical protein
MASVALADRLADRYDTALSVHVGISEPEDRRHHRRRLLSARDWAARKLSNSEYVHPDAWALYRAIHDHAGAWCFRIVVSTDDIGNIARAADNCVRLAQVASSIEGMETLHG